MSHYEFTRAKIAREARLSLRRSLQICLGVAATVVILAIVLMGGVEPVLASVSEIWGLVREGNMQALIERWVIGVASLAVMLLLALPMMGSVWLIARPPHRG